VVEKNRDGIERTHIWRMATAAEPEPMCPALDAIPHAAFSGTSAVKIPARPLAVPI